MLEVTFGVGIVAVLVLLVQPLTAKFFKRKWRYWVWLVLAVRLLVPINLSLPSIVEVELPRNEIVVTDTTPQTPVTPPEMQEVPITPETPDEPVAEPINRPVYVRPATTVKNENEKTIPITLVLGTVWVVVAVAIFSYQIISHHLFFRRINRFNHTLTDTETQEILARVCREMGITQKVDVFYNGRIQSPLLVGFFKPRILLPKFPNKTQDVEMILRHELMHFKRHDIWYKLLVRAALSMHWFNPLIWIMAKVADEDLEKACDEDVVKNQNESFRHDYCQSILHVVRMQKIKEPALAAGFSSKPSDLRNRFIRILDMTKRRGGKTALIIVACITVVSTVFIGCELGGVIDVSSNIGPSDTSSETDETSPYDVEVLVEKATEKTISKDESTMGSLKKFIGGRYVSAEAVLEDIRTLEHKVDYIEYEAERIQIVKTSIFVLDTNVGKELALVQTEFSYDSKDGLLLSKSAEIMSVNLIELGNGISVQDLESATLVFENGSRLCGIYLPKKNSVLGCVDNFKLVEIADVDKNELPIIQQTVGALQPPSAEDAFVIYRNSDGERDYLAYYNAENRTLTKLSDYECTGSGNICDMGGNRVVITYKDAIAFYDFSSEDPYKPFAIITKEDMGTETGFAPLWSTLPDKNNDKRFVAGFATEDNRLGFVSFDFDGNLKNSFVTDLEVYEENDVYVNVFADNIIYFTHVSEGYLTLNHRKYAADVRAGRSNTPQFMSEATMRMANVTPEEFRYDVSANAYPFVVNGQESVMMNDGNFIPIKQGVETVAMYFFQAVSYDAETGRLEAYVDPGASQKVQRNPWIKGDLSIENDGVYLLPYSLDLIPIPAKTDTGFIKLKIDTKDLEGLKAYAKTFDKHNVIISVAGMKITRENGELSYLVEIDDMLNSDYDYYELKNKALEILKVYGAYSEGEYGVVASPYNAFEGEEVRPLIFATPLSLLYYQDFNSTEALLDWYALYTSRNLIDGVDREEILSTAKQKFSKTWDFDGDEFEKAVTQYFDVTVDMLRNSDCYDAGTKTYKHNSEAQPDSKYVHIIKVMQKGNMMQISVNCPSLLRNPLITVELNGDSFRFVDVKETATLEVPSVFFTDLIDTYVMEKINSST